MSHKKGVYTKIHIIDKVFRSLRSTLFSVKVFFYWMREVGILSYHRCFICLKSACRVYYSYLRQFKHGRMI